MPNTTTTMKMSRKGFEKRFGRKAPFPPRLSHQCPKCLFYDYDPHEKTCSSCDMTGEILVPEDYSKS